ncbi:FadR/GntR family transcriptional regulator [Luteolibacter algae]|uniref:FadR/GntR family transcriptional regulator n=1 Tax=Luteolibacter algae TaxID=454151 RepID=A0ABW5D8L2_9BACT
MSQRSQEIIAQIEGEILSGKLAPGERLPSEERLCEAFGASRTVVREAIQQMRGRGLLRTTKGSGTYIAKPSLDSLNTAMEMYASLVAEAGFMELIDFRILIETECARLAAVNAGESIVKELRQVIGRMEGLKGSLAEFSKADISFHLVLAKGSGNRIYSGVLGAMERSCIEYAQKNHGDIDWYTDVVEGHREIVEAIALGLGDHAADAMRRHLVSSKRHFLDLDK